MLFDKMLFVIAFIFQGIIINIIMVLIRKLFLSGVASLKCNSGTSGIHGFPEDLEPADCDDGVLNCAKITGSKLKLLNLPS